MALVWVSAFVVPVGVEIAQPAEWSAVVERTAGVVQVVVGDSREVAPVPARVNLTEPHLQLLHLPCLLKYSPQLGSFQ